jgi:uncharacterized protein YbjT (DUF2867 family)
MLLVTGATGNVGRELVEALLRDGEEVRALVRDPSSAALPHDVELVRGDLAEPATLDAAVDGADGAFLLWPFTSDADADRLGPPVVQRLARSGRIVYVSAEAAIHQPDAFWGRVERIVTSADVEWTILRPTGFAANTTMWADQVRAGHVVRWPFGDAVRSLIHERDIAAVAACALREDGHHGRRYVLSGPAALTQAEQVRQIGEALGRTLRWEELDRDAALKLLSAAWGDADFARGALEAWACFVEQPEVVTDTVEAVTGRPALPFATWAREHADAFR